MILKFKNKHIMALDKLIKEGNEVGGLIESIILAPLEGFGLILEIINLGVKYTKDITILDGEGVDITRAELLWGGKGIDKTEHTKALIQRWYKITITVTYKDIPLCIVKPKLDALKPKEATGWTEPEVKEEKKKKPPVLNDIVKSWKVYDEPSKGHEITGIKPSVDILPPMTKGFMDSQNIPAPSPPPPPPPRSVRGDKASPPPPRLIVSEPWVGRCDTCGSSMKTKWLFFERGGCIQPECKNYWDKD